MRAPNVSFRSPTGVPTPSSSRTNSTRTNTTSVSLVSSPLSSPTSTSVSTNRSLGSAPASRSTSSSSSFSFSSAFTSSASSSTAATTTTTTSSPATPSQIHSSISTFGGRRFTSTFVSPSSARGGLAAGSTSTRGSPPSIGRVQHRFGARNERNVLRRLRERQVSRAANRTFVRRSAEKQYASLRLESVLETLDTNDEKALKPLAPFLRRRSRVVELVTAERMLFALTHVGVCAAFDRDCGRRLCYLNVLDDEVVRSLFYNKANRSIITVSVLRSERFSRLHCRSTPLTMLERSTPGEGFPLFEEEMLSWPGFVEFDDVNRKVITFNATTHTYNMWDLANYTLLYSVHDERIEELKMSPGVMLLIYQRSANLLPLKLVSVETGEVLKSFNRLLHRDKPIEFIEQFNSKLLIKQQSHDMQIVDVQTNHTVQVPTSLFPTPGGFIFLFSKNQFITYNKHEVLVWDFEGRLQTRFENHHLYSVSQSPSIMCVNTSQDVIFSYCRDDRDGRSNRGNVHISSLDDGRLIGRIDDTQLPDQPEFRSVLDEITSLTYNESREELYTGGRHGQIHVW
eukprot:CAMPEP_0174235938 /NCGR_PEP_ID=MMETSP0417-20130205/5224_1 /TAXON_ID=242541 /ORGANISM="Mayorella sp, Strain BSH-02190019" /LENGTH=568 /DNA_ID=CAMNT_0015314517 /DNA_START=198 /DNA_END=1901 /DNA_ORIENTATION=+